MLVVGLQGSPRIKGNTGMLLDAFLDEAKRLGATTRRIDVARKKIAPCLECGSCEKEGFCPIDDDMQETYGLLWRADLVVMATPVFFYGPTAQLKALIDRSQALWARKYMHKLSDPGRTWRRGFLLSLGATKGKNLFDGTILTAKYFFDAIGAVFSGSLTFRQIEAAGEIEKHPTAFERAGEEAMALVAPFMKRRKVLFLSRENACSSQMAGAFARLHGGDVLEIKSAGHTPADQLNPVMIDAMEERGIDMAYQKPQAVESAMRDWQPDHIISMSQEEPAFQGPLDSLEQWALTAPVEPSMDDLRQVRDDIEKKVKGLLQQ